MRIIRVVEAQRIAMLPVHCKIKVKGVDCKIDAGRTELKMYKLWQSIYSYVRT